MKVVRRSLPLLALLACLVGCASFEGPPLELEKNVELPRMLGTWYIVATIPNWFEKGFIAPVDTFTERPDHDIREDFETQWGSFAAERKHYTVRISIRPDTGNAHWRVHLGPVNLPFLLIHASADGRYLLWGEEDRSLGWIYARNLCMDDTTYRSLLRIFDDQGYDTTRFRRVVQKPGDIGQTDYWNDGIASAPAVISDAVANQEKICPPN